MARIEGPDLTSRGFRLNNPFCVAWTPDAMAWQGIDKANPKDASARGLTPLCRFSTPVYGMRAGWRTLITHQDKCGATSVRTHIAGVPDKKGKRHYGWAPAGVDNNYTDEYVNEVTVQMGVSPDDFIDVHDYATARSMGLAMMDFENKGRGVPYSDAQIDKALLMAGIEKPKDNTPAVPLSAKVTAGGLGLTTVSTMVQQVQDIAEPVTGAASTFRMLLVSLKPFAPYLVWFAIIMAATGLGVIAYRYIQNRRMGL